MLLFTVTLAGAVLGFLFYNFNPATIFMGDTGSMFLGFVLSTTAIQTNQKSSTTVALIVPIIALGVPIADTLLAMARRAARGAPLFSADRGHIHHRLLALGFSQRQAVAVLYVACAALGGIALAMSFASAGQAAWFLVGLTVVATIALWKLGYFRLEGANEVLLARRRNVLLRGGVRRVGSVLRSARSHTDIQRALRLGAKVVGATDAVLEAGGTTSTVKAFGETEGAEGSAPSSASPESGWGQSTSSSPGRTAAPKWTETPRSRSRPCASTSRRRWIECRVRSPSGPRESRCRERALHRTPKPV